MSYSRKFISNLKQIHLDNFTITSGNTNLSYPAGVFRTEIGLRNNVAGIKVTSFYVSNSKDKTEM